MDSVLFVTAEALTGVAVLFAAGFGLVVVLIHATRRRSR